MKLLILVLLTGSQSFAQSIIRTQFNGVPYTCTADASVPTNPGAGAADCAAAAYRGPFSQAQSIDLCAGALSTAPADCAGAAYRGPFSLDQSIQLCRAAYSTGPNDCALSAYRGPFSLDQSLRLCAFPSATVETANCAINAYRGPYTLEQSIQLCHTGYGPAGKKAAKPLEKTALNDLIKAANEKAVRAGEYKIER